MHTDDIWHVDMTPLGRSTTTFGTHGVRLAENTEFSQLSPSAVTIGNQLYNSATVRARELTWRWRFVAKRSMRYRLEFTSATADNDDTQPLLIELADDIIEPEIPPVPWARYEGAMRVAAWTAAHNRFIEMLCFVFGVDWILESIDTACPNSIDQEDGYALGFSIESEDESANITFGIARIPQALTPALTARAEPGSISSLWRRCDASARCIIDTVTIEAAELPMLETDSIVLIENRSLASVQPRVQLTVGDHRWLAEVDDTKIRILARSDRSLDDTHTLLEGTNMESEIEEDIAATAADLSAVQIGDTGDAPITGTVDVGSVPITLRFEAGRLVVPFERLQSIQPGFVFEFDQGLDQQTITIYANNALIATGELVLVGDRIGVRLTGARPTTVVPAAVSTRA